jgi:UDP-N-acetyl-2-amino-2-deoxyglucuronate dehydrogenase
MASPSVADTVRFGIVGAGKAAELHVAALARTPGARVTAVAGRSPQRARALAAASRARVDPSLDAMIERGDVDTVAICTPHPLHCEQAVAAALAGLHVVVEKPMALSPAECDAMTAAARESGVLLSVISQRRWYEPVRRVKEAIDGGRIGQPGLATVEVLGWRGPEYYAMDDWRGTQAGEGGGVLVNQAIHQLDLVRWFLGSAVEVDGWTANVNHLEIDVEDTAVAAVRFANGALASIVASNAQRPGLHARIHVHGRSGASVGVETDAGSSFVAGVSAPSPARNDLWTIPGEEGAIDRWPAEDEAGRAGLDLATRYHELQLRDIVGAIRDGRAPAVTGEDGRAAVELMDAIYRAARSGRRMSLGIPA